MEEIRVMLNHSRNNKNNIERQNDIDNSNHGVDLPNGVLPNVGNLSRNVNRNNITRQTDMIDDTDNNLLDGRVMPNHSRNRNNNNERQNAIDNSD